MNSIEVSKALEEELSVINAGLDALEIKIAELAEETSQLVNTLKELDN